VTSSSVAARPHHHGSQCATPVTERSSTIADAELAIHGAVPADQQKVSHGAAVITKPNNIQAAGARP
jgi:hypothetical protein